VGRAAVPAFTLSPRAPILLPIRTQRSVSLQSEAKNPGFAGAQTEYDPRIHYFRFAGGLTTLTFAVDPGIFSPFIGS
jgi:hypothetical protein